MPIVSLDSVGASGGIITSCKTTDKMVYAYWEGEGKGMLQVNFGHSSLIELDSGAKFLIWNSSFRELYEATRSKTMTSNVSRRVLTLSGNVVLLLDLNKLKPVKR